MTAKNIMSCELTLRALKEGAALKAVEQPVLVKQKENKLFVSHPNWHALLAVAEFRDVFRNVHFTVMENTEGIDEEKDRDYYAWRNKYL